MKAVMIDRFNANFKKEFIMKTKPEPIVHHPIRLKHRFICTANMCIHSKDCLHSETRDVDVKEAMLSRIDFLDATCADFERIC